MNSTSVSHSSSTFVGRIEAALTALCFGSMGVFAKWAYQGGLSVGALLSYRFVLAALILWSFLLVFKRSWILVPKKQIGIFAILGILGYASMSTTYFLAIQGLSLTMAVLLLYTYPFWVSLLSHFLTEHKITKKEVISLLIAATGLILLLGGHIEVREVTAAILGLVSAITYAFYILFSAKFQKDTHPVATSTYVISFGALALLMIYRPAAQVAFTLPSLQIWNLIGIAVVCTVLPLTLELSALKKIKSTEFSIIMMLEPVSAALWGFLIFKETLAPTQILGAVLIISALGLRFLKSNPTKLS